MELEAAGPLELVLTLAAGVTRATVAQKPELTDLTSAGIEVQA